MLIKALSEVRLHGWASFLGTIDGFAEFAAMADWEPVALRRGDPPVATLRAVTADCARARSISSGTGLGAQPLHTDGAHLHAPPHIVALAATGKHRAATRLWTATRNNVPWDDVEQGVFRVSDGRARWHRSAGVKHAIRFDPCCMTPLDGPSRRLTQFFRSAFEEAHRHEWNSDAPTVLLIDNQRVLHAREAVDPADPPRLLTRLAVWSKHAGFDDA